VGEKRKRGVQKSQSKKKLEDGNRRRSPGGKEENQKAIERGYNSDGREQWSINPQHRADKVLGNDPFKQKEGEHEHIRWPSWEYGSGGISTRKSSRGEGGRHTETGHLVFWIQLLSKPVIFVWKETTTG